jgi:hypothetical protein
MNGFIEMRLSTPVEHYWLIGREGNSSMLRLIFFTGHTMMLYDF